MAPIQSKQMPDLSDDLRRDLELAYSPELQHEAEVTFRGMDRGGVVEVSATDTEPARGVVSSKMAEGEPISTRELFSSDQRYAIATEATAAAEAAQIKIDHASQAKNIGQRVGAMRDRFLQK